MKPVGRPLAAASLALLLSACAPHAAPSSGPSGSGEFAAASEAPVSPEPTPSPDIRDSSLPPAPLFPGPSSIPSANPPAVSSKVTYPTTHPLPPLYYAESVEALVEWINTAREDDPRRHFLDIARQYEALPVVRSQAADCVLKDITVYPDHEYMFYQFEQGKNKFYILVILAYPADPQRALAERVSETNAAYEKDKRPPLREETVTFQGEPKTIYTADTAGYDYQIPRGGAIFEYGGAVVKFELSGKLTVQKAKWEHRYLDQFVFSTVPLA